MDKPACACHGEPQRWQKDPRLPKGGHWRCNVASKAHARASHQLHRDKRLAGRRGKQLAWWHAPEGGYVQRRRRHLAAQKQQILARLDTLREESERC